MIITEKLTADTMLTHGRVIWEPELCLEWTNAGLSLCFRGSRVTLHLLPPASEPEQPPYLCLEVDGAPALDAPVGLDTREVTVEGLPDREHVLRVRKRTEAREGPLRLTAVTVEGAQPALLPPPAPSPRRMEFLGDSLTCGYGNDAPRCPGYSTKQQDGTRTAAALTAAHFGVDDRYACLSGQGIVRNCNGEVDRPIPVLFHWDSPTRRGKLDFALWQPHVVVVNAGSNDVPGGVEPALLRQKAADFLRDIRRAYPQAWIIWSYGMLNTDMMEPLRQAVEDVQDSRAVFLPLEPITADETGGEGHPNLAAHRRFAGVYIPLIAKLTGWE